ncbi:hypothetical protein GLOTRDRAFT_110292 [Gloeophyllum trabeum ATCC 11539]|uniref:Uncharacterized protein n=1 Tax=Gloeophyllum trabeum (strain ATCC 11539 / FP-39264 / Madison 617) TaxID=670483 RepID=S7QHK6_GLOTA|nr:uncharacterized protein GLOTRDRAFT_110292 [Gloeophyllum trabeum ATCC 11539]EPQ58652.1 hypothetical protein GLOTRDRAFT_110292 [Gloeophyllum trabeum ATCC 11539]
MVGGRKRAAAEEGSGPTTRASKAAKTGDGAAAGKSKGGKRGGPKANMAANTFKANALPLHVNITHTPPSVADKNTVPATAADPGSLGSITLVPSVFATGSYGWKGNKRIQVEISNPEGGGEKEKVHVQLTINATVLGSKGAGGDEDKEEKEAEEAKEEAAEEAKENGDGEENAEEAAE